MKTKQNSTIDEEIPPQQGKRNQNNQNATHICNLKAQMLVLIKLPYLKSTILCSKLSKGMGHNYYGEPA